MVMLVLASNSPRRRQLLSLGGWNFIVLTSEVDESILPDESPVSYVRRLSLGKAEDVLHCLSSRNREGKLIIAADTAVVVQKQKINSITGFQAKILGKPLDRYEAESMLRHLRARQHEVFTALTVIRAVDEKVRTEVIKSIVTMRDFTDEEMLAYISSGDPLDKAGAYAIQHTGFHPVVNFQGCYANVMGLPICQLSRLLTQFEVSAETSIPEACQEYLNYTCPIYHQVMQQEGNFIG